MAGAFAPPPEQVGPSPAAASIYGAFSPPPQQTGTPYSYAGSSGSTGTTGASAAPSGGMWTQNGQGWWVNPQGVPFPTLPAGAQGVDAGGNVQTGAWGGVPAGYTVDPNASGPGSTNIWTPQGFVSGWTPGYGGAGGAGGAGGSGGSGGGSNPNGGMSAGQTQNALDLVESAYPWLAQMGLSSQLQQWVVQGLSPDAIVAEIRNTSQYQAMFPAIRRPDGTMRMNESQYLSTQDNYRTLMKQYGRPGTDYSSPQNYVGLFQNEIDPNEFKQRLDTYDQISRSSYGTKAAFYVYAGMNVSTDQLYQAMVDPQAQAQLTSEYNQSVALAPADYQTFITRATEFALSQAGDQAAQSFGPGSPTTSALQSIDPSQAQLLMDNLYHGLGYGAGQAANVPLAEPAPGQTAGQPQLLNLNQLMHAFQNALIGGAALTNGLALPGQDRIEQFRQAGIGQADALQGFQQIGANRADWTGALQRSGLGTGFSQDQLENALFLKSTPDLTLLQRAEESDKALQDAGSNFSFTGTQSGSFAQRGMRASLT